MECFLTDCSWLWSVNNVLRQGKVRERSGKFGLLERGNHVVKRIILAWYLVFNSFSCILVFQGLLSKKIQRALENRRYQAKRKLENYWFRFQKAKIKFQ